MISSPRPSASVIAAGIAAILGSVIVAAFSVFMLVAMNALKIAEKEPMPPAFAKALIDVVWFFFLAAAIYVCVCGVGVMRLQRWARISLMVVAGVMLFFSLTGVAVAIIVLFATPLPGPPGTKLIVAGILVLIYGAPFAIALWWLILFTRPSVVGQFEARRATLPPARGIRVKKPGCPLPIAIVAWFSLMSVLNLLILPFLPFRLPVVLFGHLFRGSAAGVMLLCLAALVVASGIGLLRLQRWSYPVSLGLQLFYMANLLITTLNPSYLAQLRFMLAEMHLPAMPPGFPDLLPYMRYLGLAGLLIPVACAVCLIYSREAFLAAAQADQAAGPQNQST
ncbi:MAG TPA: hypothetical protein VLX32_03510 [Candidatus Acidoferrum sp.]|nr:hypothetical protein [Candidatus Acidoferrum sp.]